MLKNRVGIVILSRYNSSRLPGKALMKIKGKTILEIITERLLNVVQKTDIIIATSTEKSDNAIAHWASENGFNCYRGSLDNVAERFYRASEVGHCQYALRINGDNVFVDTAVLKAMLALIRTGQYDFITNVKGRTFPKGMSIEAVKKDYYASLLPTISEDALHREHVTSYLYEHDNGRYYYFYNHQRPEASGIQLALDTAEDFERTKKIMERFSDDHWKYNLEEIYTIWKQLEHEQSF